MSDSNDLQPFDSWSSYAAYLIRFWRDTPSAEWRASAQHVLSRETRHFATVDALIHYLRSELNDKCGDHPEP